MVRRTRWLMGLAAAALLAGGPLHAQDPDLEETGPAVERLRQAVEQRFSAYVRTELQLTDEQAQKLRANSQQFGQQRRQIAVDERQLRRALDDQMRPGIAANQDSVTRLMNGIADRRQAYAKTFEDERRSLTFLSPVQQARYLQLRERLLDRLREARARARLQGGGPGGGGAGARERPLLRPRANQRPLRP